MPGPGRRAARPRNPWGSAFAATRAHPHPWVARASAVRAARPALAFRTDSARSVNRTQDSSIGKRRRPCGRVAPGWRCCQVRRSPARAAVGTADAGHPRAQALEARLTFVHRVRDVVARPCSMASGRARAGAAGGPVESRPGGRGSAASRRPARVRVVAVAGRPLRPGPPCRGGRRPAPPPRCVKPPCPSPCAPPLNPLGARSGRSPSRGCPCGT